MYFEKITTIEDLKKAYRKLATRYHPDNRKTGNVEEMQKINKKYEEPFNSLKNGTNKANNTNENSFDFIKIINELMKYDNLTIEIIGTWIWLDKENTYDIKDVIKGLGFLWSSGRKKWYFNGGQEKQRINYKQKTFNALKSEYGCETIKTNKKDELKKLN